MLIDSKRNVVLADGFNGGPRKGADLCAELHGIAFCERAGLERNDFWIDEQGENTAVHFRGHQIPHPRTGPLMTVREAKQLRLNLLQRYPGVPSGTHYEVGCHHAEQNVICNAAARGTATAGAWLIVTGEPCIGCARLIHHAAITKVLCVEGGHVGLNGLAYLEQHGVAVEHVPGPQDPRADAAAS